MTVYEEAVRLLGEDRIVVLTLGVDLDGDRVICTSSFDADTNGEDFLLHPDPAIRAGHIIGMVVAISDHLRESHGIKTR